MSKDFDFKKLKEVSLNKLNDKQIETLEKAYRNFKIALYFDGEYRRRKFLIDYHDKIEDLRYKYLKFKNLVQSDRLIYDTLVQDYSPEENDEPPSEQMDIDDLSIQEEISILETSKEDKTSSKNHSSSVYFYDPLCQGDLLFTGFPMIINDIQLVSLCKNKTIELDYSFLTEKDFCDFFLKPESERNYNSLNIDTDLIPLPYGFNEYQEDSALEDSDEDNEYDEDFVDRTLEEFNNISMKYGLYISDLILKFKIDDTINIIDFNDIDDSIIYKPIPTKDNLSRIVTYSHGDVSKAKDKHLSDMIDLLYYESIETQPYNRYGSIQNKYRDNKDKIRVYYLIINEFFKGTKKNIYSRSALSRYIGLWLWDHYSSPLAPKDKKLNDLLFKAVKFRFDNEEIYRENFLKGNDLKEFPDEIDKDKPYIENQFSDMRKILRNTKESIQQMKIIPLRIETDKQKETKKSKKIAGLSK